MSLTSRVCNVTHAEDLKWQSVLRAAESSALGVVDILY